MTVNSFPQTVCVCVEGARGEGGWWIKIMWVCGIVMHLVWFWMMKTMASMISIRGMGLFHPQRSIWQTRQFNLSTKTTVRNNSVSSQDSRFVTKMVCNTGLWLTWDSWYMINHPNWVDNGCLRAMYLLSKVVFIERSVLTSVMQFDRFLSAMIREPPLAWAGHGIAWVTD